MVQEYIKNFEKLFLCVKGKIAAKDFLEADRFHTREKNIIDELVSNNYLCECSYKNQKFYSLGDEAIQLLKKETYRWEALQQEKIFLEKQFLQEIKEYLKKIFFHSEESLDVREILEIDKFNAKNKEFVADLVDEQYLEECLNDNKRYEIGSKGWDLLKKDDDNWQRLLKKKKEKQDANWRDFLNYIENNGQKGLSADIKKQFSYELEYASENDLVENSSHKYSLTAKGAHFLYTLRPPVELLQDLHNDFENFKNKFSNIEKIITQQHQGLVKNLEKIEEHLQQKFIALNDKLQETGCEITSIKSLVHESEIANKWKREIVDKIVDVEENFSREQDLLKTKWLNQQKQQLEIYQQTLHEQESKIKEERKYLQDEIHKLDVLYQGIYDILNSDIHKVNYPQKIISSQNKNNQTLTSNDIEEDIHTSTSEHSKSVLKEQIFQYNQENTRDTENHLQNENDENDINANDGENIDENEPPQNDIENIDVVADYENMDDDEPPQNVDETNDTVDDCESMNDDKGETNDTVEDINDIENIDAESDQNENVANDENDETIDDTLQENQNIDDSAREEIENENINRAKPHRYQDKKNEENNSSDNFDGGEDVKEHQKQKKYDQTIEMLEKKFNAAINKKYQKPNYEIDNDNQEDNQEDSDIFFDNDENVEEFETFTSYNEEEYDSEYVEDDDSDSKTKEKIFSEIQKYYKLTYFRHRGTLKLSFLFEYLENELEVNREYAKSQIKNLFREGVISLDSTKEIDKYGIDNIICDGTNFYYALHIDPER